MTSCSKKRAPSWEMRDVTRKGLNKLILSQYIRVGLVAQWYGARIVTQKDGGSSLGAGVRFFFIYFLSFSVFCFVLFCLVCFFFIKIKKCRHF